MIEYVNLAAVVWLTFNILMTAYTIDLGIQTGRRMVRVNIIPLILSIASLITLGIAAIKEIPV